MGVHSSSLSAEVGVQCSDKWVSRILFIVPVRVELDGRGLKMLVVLSLYLFMLHRFMYVIHKVVQ
jgi:hypothetical protein